MSLYKVYIVCVSDYIYFVTLFSTIFSFYKVYVIPVHWLCQKIYFAKIEMSNYTFCKNRFLHAIVFHECCTSKNYINIVFEIEIFSKSDQLYKNRFVEHVKSSFPWCEIMQTIVFEVSVHSDIYSWKNVNLDYSFLKSVVSENYSDYSYILQIIHTMSTN